MPIGYVPILVLIVIAVIVALSVLAISLFLGPRRSSSQRMVPYESGIRPVASAHRRYPVKFFLVAMLFIVFDIEAIFFYPWAVTFKQLRVFGLVEMFIFIAILLVGYFYIVKKGALEWE